MKKEKTQSGRYICCGYMHDEEEAEDIVLAYKSVYPDRDIEFEDGYIVTKDESDISYIQTFFSGFQEGKNENGHIDVRRNRKDK
jgi:hypothetical protein